MDTVSVIRYRGAESEIIKHESPNINARKLSFAPSKKTSKAPSTKWKESKGGVTTPGLGNRQLGLRAWTTHIRDTNSKWQTRQSQARTKPMVAAWATASAADSPLIASRSFTGDSVLSGTAEDDDDDDGGGDGGGGGESSPGTESREMLIAFATPQFLPPSPTVDQPTIQTCVSNWTDLEAGTCKPFVAFAKTPGGDALLKRYEGLSAHMLHPTQIFFFHTFYDVLLNMYPEARDVIVPQDDDDNNTNTNNNNNGGGGGGDADGGGKQDATAAAAAAADEADRKKTVALRAEFLFELVKMLMSLLTDKDVLTTLASMAEKHFEVYGLRAKHYDMVSRALIYTLMRCSGDERANGETMLAWHHSLSFVMRVLVQQQVGLTTFVSVIHYFSFLCYIAWHHSLSFVMRVLVQQQVGLTTFVSVLQLVQSRSFLSFNDFSSFVIKDSRVFFLLFLPSCLISIGRARARDGVQCQRCRVEVTIKYSLFILSYLVLSHQVEHELETASNSNDAELKSPSAKAFSTAFVPVVAAAADVPAPRSRRNSIVELNVPLPTVGSATALATVICVRCTPRSQISR
jgi:hypothetical protein